MASILEKAISIFAGNLNSGCSYLITAVAQECDMILRWASFRLYFISCIRFTCVTTSCKSKVVLTSPSSNQINHSMRIMFSDHLILNN